MDSFVSKSVRKLKIILNKSKIMINDTTHIPYNKQNQIRNNETDNKQKHGL